MYDASYQAAGCRRCFCRLCSSSVRWRVALVVWYGGLLALRFGLITPGDIQAFVGYVTFMLWPVQEMARVFAQMQQSVASGERVFSLLDAVPAVQDAPDAATPGSIRRRDRL